MLVFIHIPKTAGTTLHKILVHQADPGGVLVRHDADGAPSAGCLEYVTRRDRLGGLMVLGHQSVGLHRRIPGVRYVTCVREPVARLLSHYQHAFHDPAHYLHRAIHKHGWGPAEYVASGVSGELGNCMVRMLAGLEDFHGAIVDEAALKIAKCHLEEHFDAVIPSERFDEGVLMLAKARNWPLPYYLRRKVGKGNKPQLDDAALKVIRGHNGFDLELYSWAIEKFERQVSAEHGLAKDLEQFQRLNRFPGPLLYGLRELRHRLVHRECIR